MCAVRPYINKNFLSNQTDGPGCISTVDDLNGRYNRNLIWPCVTGACPTFAGGGAGCGGGARWRDGGVMLMTTFGRVQGRRRCERGARRDATPGPVYHGSSISSDKDKWYRPTLIH